MKTLLALLILSVLSSCAPYPAYYAPPVVVRPYHPDRCWYPYYHTYVWCR